MSKHWIHDETPYTCPPILPRSRSNYDLTKLTSHNSRIKDKGSRYYHDECIMKQNRVREYHQAEHAFEHEQYEVAARICYEIVKDDASELCSEGIMARANMLLARPEMREDAVCREHHALEAIRWWTKIIVHHERGHRSETPIMPVEKVYSKYPADLAKWMREQSQELLDDALTDQNDELYLGTAVSSHRPEDQDDELYWDPSFRSHTPMDLSE